MRIVDGPHPDIVSCRFRTMRERSLQSGRFAAAGGVPVDSAQYPPGGFDPRCEGARTLSAAPSVFLGAADANQHLR